MNTCAIIMLVLSMGMMWLKIGEAVHIGIHTPLQESIYLDRTTSLPEPLVWRMQCVEVPKEYYMRVHTGNYSYDKKFRNRTDLQCWSEQDTGCFVAVYDDFLSEKENAELLQMTQDRDNHRATYRETTSEVYLSVQARIMEVLQHELGAGDIVTLPRMTWETLHADSSGNPKTNWSQGHSDYLSSMAGERWVYTSLLYFSGEEAEGGETGFVQNDPKWMREGEVHNPAGVIVSPRKRRLAVFTGGAETWHSRLPLTSGSRSFMQSMYDCKGRELDPEPEWTENNLHCRKHDEL